MAEFVCIGCGKTCRNAGALATHLKSCKKAPDQKTEEAAGEEMQALEQRIERLEDLVQKLVDFHTVPGGIWWDGVHRAFYTGGNVRPSGELNPFAVLLTRMIQVERNMESLKLETAQSQEAFGREIRGWVWQVIPDNLRPSL